MQRLRRLSGRRAARLEEGAFVIEGPTLVAEALPRRARSRRCSSTAGGRSTAWSPRPRRAGAAVRTVDGRRAGARRSTPSPRRGWPPSPRRLEVGVDDGRRRGRGGPARARARRRRRPRQRRHAAAGRGGRRAPRRYCSAGARSTRATRSACGHRRARCSTCRWRAEGRRWRCSSGSGERGCARRPRSCAAARPTTRPTSPVRVALVLGSEAHGLPADVRRASSTSGSRSRWPGGPSRSTWPWPARCCASSRCASGGAAPMTRSRPRPPARPGARRSTPTARLVAAQRRRPRRARRRRRGLRRPALGEAFDVRSGRAARPTLRDGLAVHRGRGRPHVPAAPTASTCRSPPRSGPATGGVVLALRPVRRAQRHRRSSPRCPTSCAARSRR